MASLKPSVFVRSDEFHFVLDNMPAHLKQFAQPHCRMATIRKADGQVKGGISSPHKPGKCYFPHVPYRLGSNGHNFVDCATIAVPIDIDIGHGANQITPEQAEELIAAIREHKPPGVILCRSTGGKGIHLWIILSVPMPTPGTTLEAMNAQHQLNCKLVCCALDTYLPGISLPSLVDVIGQNTWIYTSEPKCDSFKLLYQSDEKFPEVDPALPITGFRSNSAHKQLKKSGVPLTDMSERQWALVDRLECSLNYDHVAGVISGHSAAFLPFVDEMLGPSYNTNSTANNLHEPNCAIIPLTGGGFIVAMYGTQDEAPGPNWWLSNGGHWCCFVDVFPSLDSLVDYHDGEWVGKEAVFTGDERGNVLRSCGITTDLANDLDLFVKDCAKGRVFRQPKDESEDSPGKAGHRRGSFIYNRAWWVYTLATKREERNGTDRQTVQVVALVENSKSIGTVICDPHEEPTVLSSWINHGHSTTNVVQRRGGTIDDIQRAEANPHRVVYRPLQPVFPAGEGRVMNRSQVAYIETPHAGEWPFIQSIFNHLGKNLTPYVLDSPGCREMGIIDGPDYLRHWACVTLFPGVHPRLPALQLYGPKSGGKSAWWLLFSSLLRDGHGVANMYRALTSDTGFNKALQDCILAYLDEKNLAKPKIRDGFKDAISSTKIDIRKMQTDEYRVDSTFSVFAAYNFLSHGIHDLEDRRSVFVQVDELPEDTRVGDGEFSERVQSEAAAFLHHVQEYRLLDSKRPLYLPVFVTAGKVEGWRALRDEDKVSTPAAYRLHQSYLLARWVDENRPDRIKASDLQAASGVSLGVRQIGDILRIASGQKAPSTSEDYTLDVDWFARRGIEVEPVQVKNTHQYSFAFGEPNRYPEF